MSLNLLTTTAAAQLLRCHPNSAVRILDGANIRPVCLIGAARAYEPEAVRKLAARRMIRKFYKRSR